MVLSYCNLVRFRDFLKLLVQVWLRIHRAQSYVTLRHLSIDSLPWCRTFFSFIGQPVLVKHFHGLDCHRSILVFLYRGNEGIALPLRFLNSRDKFCLVVRPCILLWQGLYLNAMLSFFFSFLPFFPLVVSILGWRFYDLLLGDLDGDNLHHSFKAAIIIRKLKKMFLTIIGGQWTRSLLSLS